MQIDEMNLKIDSMFKCFESFTFVEDDLYNGELGRIKLILERNHLKNGVLKIFCMNQDESHSSLPYSNLADFEFKHCALTFKKLQDEVKNSLKNFLDGFEEETMKMKEIGFGNQDFNTYSCNGIFVHHLRSFIADPKILIWTNDGCFEAHTGDMVEALIAYGKNDFNKFQLLPFQLRDLINMKETTVQLERLT